MLNQAVQQATEGGHSWYPVCRGGLDDVVGVVHLKKMLALHAQGIDDGLQAHAEPAVFVPETLSGMELLEQFRARATRLVFVVDEYGVVQGILAVPIQGSIPLFVLATALFLCAATCMGIALATVAADPTAGAANGEAIAALVSTAISRHSACSVYSTSGSSNKALEKAGFML